MKLHLQHTVVAAPPISAEHGEADATADASASHVLDVACMFGLGADETQQIQIIPPTDLDLSPSEVVFITGPSGSGKSTLLRLIDQAVAARDDAKVLHFDRLPALPDRPLVDCFGDAPLERVLRWLSLAGLNDAFVMLRRPAELSDGQRYRLRLAQVMGMLDQHEDGQALTIVLADEFGATLDRLTAAIIARNIRKWASASQVCFIAATTHDDLLEPMQPDTLIVKDLGQRVDIVRAET